MEQHSEVLVGVDAAKLRHAVAVAEDGRRGEVRCLGEIGADTESVRRLAARLEKRHGGWGLHFCYEAGPTGYGLYRQLTELGHRCTVVAPSLTPRRPGDHVKTNRRETAGHLLSDAAPGTGVPGQEDLGCHTPALAGEADLRSPRARAGAAGDAARRPARAGAAGADRGRDR